MGCKELMSLYVTQYGSASLVPRLPTFLVRIAAEKAGKPGDEAMAMLLYSNPLLTHMQANVGGMHCSACTDIH